MVLKNVCIVQTQLFLAWALQVEHTTSDTSYSSQELVSYTSSVKTNLKLLSYLNLGWIHDFFVYLTRYNSIPLSILHLQTFNEQLSKGLCSNKCIIQDVPK